MRYVSPYKINNINELGLFKILVLTSLLLLIPLSLWGQTASISGTTEVCQNASSPNITFEGLNGTAPYTFTYSINGILQLPLTTTPSSNTYFLSAPTSLPGPFNYILESVTDDAGDVFAITNNSITITVNSLLPVSVSIVTISNTICSGSSVTFTATPANGGSSPSYQWKVNNSNAGTNSPIFTTSALANNDIVTVVLTSSETCTSGNPATSNAITMIVNPLLPVSVNISALPSGAVCRGTSVNFTAVPVNGGTVPQYQWKVNGTNAGANSSTFSYSPLNNEAIICVLTSNATCETGSPAISNTITMSVNPLLPVSVGISAAPTGAICAGTSVLFTASPINGGTPVYQWKLNGGNVGSNSPNYSSSTLNNFDVVTLVMTSTATCPTGNPATSNPVTMTVSQNLPVNVSIGASVNPVCPGNSVVFSATPVNGGTAPQYQWKVNGVNAGTNTSTYSYIPVNNDEVTCLLTSSLTCTTGSPATSNTVKMIITPVVGTPGTPSPSSTTICQGSSSTSYNTSATDATSFNWTVSGAGNTISGTGSTGTVSWSNTFSGSATISVTANGCNGPSAPASTTVNVLPSPSAAISGSTTVCLNAAAPYITFTNPQTLPIIITYNINGSNQSTISVDANATANVSASTTASGTFNYNIVSVDYQSGPTCSNALTGTATITINPLPTVILTSSEPDNVFCFGTSVTFTASGGTGFEFKVGTTTVQNGPLPTYVTTSLTNGQKVSVIVTNANGCSAISQQIQNIVNPLPGFIITPSPTCSIDLQSYSFGVTVVGSGTVTCNYGIVTHTGGNNWTISQIPKGTDATMKVTDSGCEASQLVTAPNCTCLVVQAPVSGGDKSYCASGIIPAITATVQTGSTVDWYDSSSGGTLLLGGSLTYTPSAAGTYYALAREVITNCISSTRTPVTVTEYPLPTPTLSSSDADNIFCSGTSITFIAGGGTSYNFRVSGASVQNGSSPTYTTGSLINGQVVDVVVTNESGCSQTSAGITNTVNALPVPTLTSSDADNSFCSGTSVTFTAGGGTSYNFVVAGISVQNGASTVYTTNSLTNGQVIDVIVTNAAGCTATSLGITNTVNEQPLPGLSSSDADNIFCSGTSVTFTATGGTSYIFRVNGVATQSGTSPTFTTSALTNGQVVDVLAISANGGCSATSTGITNSVNVSPNANAGTDGNGCDLNFSLNAVPSLGTGTWSLASGAGTATFSPDAHTPGSTVTVSEYGTYSFRWTEVSGSCSSSSTVKVNFFVQPVANPGTGGSNCGLGFYLKGTLNSGTGSWSKVSGPGNATFSPDENTAEALVTVSAFGSYVFKWSVVNGTCSNSATITVNFMQQTSSDAGTGGQECDKDFVFNALATAGVGTWTKVSGPGNATFEPDSHQTNAKVTVDKAGTYNFAWTVVSSICSSVDVVTVVFHDLPLIDAGVDTAVCKGGSIKLHAQGVGSFAWKPTELFKDPAIEDPVVSPLTTTTFTVNLTDLFGCKNSDDIVVDVRENINAKAGPDQVLDYTFETSMDAVLAHDYETGLWSIISGTGDFLDSTDSKSLVEKLSVGVNEFLWTVKNGICSLSRDTVSITIKDFIIPTLITPNMDGRNDYFVLGGLKTLGKTELVIFDRRGAEVYKNLNYDNSWNGVDYNKNPLPDDTYYFILRSATGKSSSGYIVIRR